MCQNIDDFNRGAAFVLAALYRSFPAPVALKTAALDAGDDLADDERDVRLDEMTLGQLRLYAQAAAEIEKDRMLRAAVAARAAQVDEKGWKSWLKSTG